MLRPISIFSIVMMFALGGVLMAQDATEPEAAPTAAPTAIPVQLGATTSSQSDGDGSTVNWFYTTCIDRVVIDLSGFMEDGWDLYYQVFRGLPGSEDAITPLRRLQVRGDYSLSQVIMLNGSNVQVAVGQTTATPAPEATAEPTATPAPGSLLVGQFTNAVLRIARENDPEDIQYETTLQDALDICNEPAFSSAASQNLGGGVFQSGEKIDDSGILKPGSGYLNEVYYFDPGQTIQIGARQRPPAVPGRTSNPGLIFAECQDYPGSEPGVLYTTDTLIVFWSWFARTPEQVQDHLNKARYNMMLDRQQLPLATASAIERREDGNYWVFFTVNLGDKWRPGTYNVEYQLSWAEPTNDGYEDFGPGTENEFLNSGCTFTVQQDPNENRIVPENPKVPLMGY